MRLTVTTIHLFVVLFRSALMLPFTISLNLAICNSKPIKRQLMNELDKWRKKFHMNFVDFFPMQIVIFINLAIFNSNNVFNLDKRVAVASVYKLIFFSYYCCSQSQLHTIFQFIFAIRYLNTIFCLFHRMHQRIIYYIKRTGLNKFRNSNGKKSFKKMKPKTMQKVFEWNEWTWSDWGDIGYDFLFIRKKAFSREWNAIWTGDTYTLPPQNNVVLINISKTHMLMTGLRWHSFQLAILLVRSTSIIRRWLITCERL